MTGTDVSFAREVADYAIKWPITVELFALLLAISYALRWVAKEGWPKWQEAQEKRQAATVAEAEKTRAHMTAVLAARGAEAEAAVRNVQELEALKQKAIVDGVSAKVAAVHDKVGEVHAKVSDIHGIVQRLAGKGALALLIVLLSAATALCGYRVAQYITIRTNKQCTQDSDCREPKQYCCSNGTCCRNASNNAVASQPHSSGASAREYSEASYFPSPMQERTPGWL